MVATISARGGAKSALAYYSHLSADNYYTRDGEPPGRWAGEGAERLSLEGPVTRAEFEAALTGLDPKTGARLAALGGRNKTHSAGWDMTFSAPKSVSVMWALSEKATRERIEKAHVKAILKAAKSLEKTSAWARRGKGGRIKERTAGLLMAQFDHHTSRDLDPQLHTHSFIFNLAPRKDGTWGAILSRELYKAQKQAGLDYRTELASELEREGFAIERTPDNFRMKAIPRRIEKAFSKRRQAIEKAAETYGYDTAKGMELASLRTRQHKQKTETKELYGCWKSEAKALGFEFKQEKVRAPSVQIGREVPSKTAVKAPAFSATNHTAPSKNLSQINAKIAQVARAVNRLAGPTQHGASSPGPRLQQRKRLLERDYER
jgi:conjugative relaxase-like TrwC/TraI family protein